MKTIPHFAFILLIATLMLSCFPTDAEAEIYGDTVRLHILANSDSGEDQSLKLAVRDRLLAQYGEILKDSASIIEAKSLAEELIPAIERDAKEWITELGYSYNVLATLTTEWYETREYEDFTLPCGYYTSLRLIIGNGDGKNWWCVMYPPLCMEIATEKAPSDDGLIDYTKEEILLIKKGGYNVKFKILEDLSRVFSKNS